MIQEIMALAAEAAKSRGTAAIGIATKATE